jgi:hypothetical protein
MYSFCTYFDRNYLVRGLALYESLVAHVDSFTLYVLCFDDSTYDFLRQRRYHRIVPISLEEFEKGDDALVRCKGGRSGIEYFFTCTPSLPLYILNNYEVDLITYIDADMFFFSSPEPVFHEFGQNSIMIIGHRFSEKNKDFERYGKYNVGYLSFRNDESGRQCLEWWRSKCIEWCYDREEDGRFADQKYLDDWPDRFDKVHVLKHKGVNLAPWNLDNYKVHEKGNRVFVDDDVLIAFHFHGLNKTLWSIFNVGTRVYGTTLNRILMTNIYKIYINCIHGINKIINKGLGSDRYSTNRVLSFVDLKAKMKHYDMIFCSKHFPVVSLNRRIVLRLLLK